MQGLTSVLSVVLAAVLLFAAEVRVLAKQTELTASVRAGKVLVTLEPKDFQTDSLQSALRRGLKARFTYTVELRTAARFWFDVKRATTIVRNSIYYDPSAKTYFEQLTVDGRIGLTRTSTEEHFSHRELTGFSRVPLFLDRKLEPNYRYRIEVWAHLELTDGSLFFPWGRGVLGTTTFIFTP